MTPAPADSAPWSDTAQPYAEALRTGRGPLFLRRADGWLLPLDVERWCGLPDAADWSVLSRCAGSVLDIGCGPGRLVAALAQLGRPALGIDVSAVAVARTQATGASALRRSVFDPLPGEGRWGTTLLMDGNIGIGGDPAALLARAAGLVGPGGRCLVEVLSYDVDERVRVHVSDGSGADARGPSFPWARVGAAALVRYAVEAGWVSPAGWSWTSGARSFVGLRRDGG
ncbi:class I SAM-dependent methyltransferase [Streptomyces sp. NPDC051940]|uniref:class I SAM-dependent methyltransferase n=1 Tax=Streptomyces sp. NPDC051940 TaxID=3155675 RepID=UPI003428708C